MICWLSEGRTGRIGQRQKQREVCEPGPDAHGRSVKPFSSDRRRVFNAFQV